MRKQVHGLILLGIFTLPFLGLASPMNAQLWSGILSPSRAVDWSNAGVIGGIPSASWSQCGTTIPAYSGTATTINNAIAACPANHYVLLGAGTFNLSGGIIFNVVNNVVLRGSGADQTFLIFTGNNSCQGLYSDICFQSADTNYWGSPSNLANWTAGYAKGTTSVTLSSVSNLAVGTPVTFDQTDDTTDSGDIYVCYTIAICSRNGDNGGAPRPGRSQQQIVTVTSISGTGPYTVGISPGIYMPNWTAAKTPQAWWPTSPISGSGVENLSADHTNSGATIGFGIFNCNGCWVKGVRSIDPGRSHIQIFQSIHVTAQDNYLWRTANQTSSSYGIEAFASSDSLIQNNISQAISGPWVVTGSCSGCVWSYNFDLNNFYNSSSTSTPNYTWQQQGLYPHAVGDDNILIEGNQGEGIDSDNFHGTHHFLTIYRNNYNGFQPNNGTTTNNGIGPLNLLAFSRFYNVVGNVLGTTGYPYTAYECTVTNCPSSIWNLSILTIGTGDGVPNDPNTQRTLMLWGNYDTVTGAARWCGNSSDPGWSTTCASTSEVPSAITNYSNPIPSSTTLPASFYLSSKPSWWPSAKAWPAIGPDVSGGSGPGGHAYTIPAADCYTNTMSGSSNGVSSGALSFNAASCYGQQNVTTGPTPLAAPTNLTAVAK